MVGHRYNLTCADAPIFLLADLEPDVTFRAAVYAVNAKGRSPAVLIEELTFRDAERRTGKEERYIAKTERPSAWHFTTGEFKIEDV